MKRNFFDCFMLVGTALSLNEAPKSLPEMGRPILQEATTTRVYFSLTVEKVQILEGKDELKIRLDVILNQKWIDPRLGSDTETQKRAVAGQIWKPRISALNAKRVNYENDDTVFWRGYSDDGSVVLSEKLFLQALCNTKYSRFPFDEQSCKFQFGSYRFLVDEVVLLWDSQPVDFLPDFLLTDFKMTNVSTSTAMISRRLGNFSLVEMQLIFCRNFNQRFYYFGLPIVILTILNYATVWISLRQRLIRLYLNFVLFLTIFYFYYFFICLSKPTFFLTASDLFVLVSLSFSVVTLLEILIVNIFYTRKESLYYLKNVAVQCSLKIYWVELAIKLCYPIFYIFFLFVYSLTYIY